MIISRCPSNLFLILKLDVGNSGVAYYFLESNLKKKMSCFFIKKQPFTSSRSRVVSHYKALLISTYNVASMASAPAAPAAPAAPPAPPPS